MATYPSYNPGGGGGGGGGAASDITYAPTIANPATNVQSAITNTDNQLVETYIALTDIPAGKALYQVAGTNQVGLGDNTDPIKSNIIGFSLNTVLTGQTVTCRDIGEIINSSWALTQGENQWLSTAGNITNTRPLVGKYETIVGQAMTTTKLGINIVYNGLRSF